MASKIPAKIAKIPTRNLREMAEMLRDDLSDAATLVQDAILAELAGRIPEAEFVAFCDTL